MQQSRYINVLYRQESILSLVYVRVCSLVDLHNIHLNLKKPEFKKNKTKTSIQQYLKIKSGNGHGKRKRNREEGRGGSF